MKALVCHAFGEPESLSLEDLPRPVPGQGEVLVEVHAIGTNFVEVLVTSGRSQLKRRLPLIPGVEASGVVLEVGPGVTRIRPGQRVLGTKVQGCYAEEALFEEDELAVIPEGMDLNTAAVFYIANYTVYYSLIERARLKAGENLLVLGAGGGCGLAGVEIGKAVGARVIAAASSNEKLALAKAHGADELVLYEKGPLDLAAQKAFAKDLLGHAQRTDSNPTSIHGKYSTLSAHAGYHVVLDGVGGTYAEPALRTLGWQGRYLSYGFAAGMAHTALGPALFKNADIMGIQPSEDDQRMPGRNPKMMEDLFGWYREGRIRPEITKVFPLADFAKAFRALQGREAMGRVVVTTPRAA